MRPSPIRILIADDHELFRAGVASLLDREPDFEVVGQARNGVEAVELAQRVQPNIVLLDIQMPESNGLEATRRLIAQQPELKIIMLTVSDSDGDLFEAIKAGAQGYLQKGTVKPHELVEAVQRVATGEAIITPALVPHLLAEFVTLAQNSTSTNHAGDPSNASEPETEPSLNALTARELEVLHLVAAGLKNREIGERLIISENTVRSHVRSILDKLHVKNRIQAATIYQQEEN
jgi:DNA-binding NarL/FixJ family response regulator